MKKVMFCIGTRPEAIKVAPVIRKFISDKYFKTIVCLTGQHKEMLTDVLDTFKIDYDFNLDVMMHDQTLLGTTSLIMCELDKIIKKVNPDLIFVHGDTNTTFSSSLIAFYNNVKVAHIEAGLRTYDTYNPWPEETFRQLTARIATIHFPPTKSAHKNLVNEKINFSNILVTGNTVIDALKLCIEIIDSDYKLKDEIFSFFNNYKIDLNECKKKIILITGHRRENRGDGITNLCEAIKELAEKHSDFTFIFPVHLSPHVKDVVYDYFDNDISKNIFLIPPLNYTKFVYLMSISKLIITDSGGIQEEAPTFKVPVLVTRTTSERLEAVDMGAVKLIGSKKERIVKEASILLNSKTEYEKMKISKNPYGNGFASEKIIDFVKLHI